MKNFQLILLIVFGFFIIGGLIAFATYRNTGGENELSPITVWGTFPASDINALTKSLKDSQDIDLRITYREIAPNQFDQILLEAIAAGKGPDAMFLPLDLLYRYEDKIIPISFETFSERDFRATYVEAAELFLGEGEVKAFPFAIDPLVMYWNRNLFNNAAIPNVPEYWHEFLTLVPKLTAKDGFSNITQSAVALGEYRNVTNAKGIVSALLLQSGNQITDPVIQSSALSEAGSINAINFYTEFANPVKPSYSWNRSLSPSKTRFLSGELAIYFGYASELEDLREKNPNLNFDVAPFPQIQNAAIKRTYGRLHGVAVLRYSPNAGSAYQTLIRLTGKESIAAWSSITNMPPVRRDLLSTAPSSAALSVFYDSALWARSFLDPNPATTDRVFMTMVESITSGQSSVGEAVTRANQEITNAFKQ